MSKNFEQAHEFTAAWEGGYVNHPSDPGGETNLGVTKRVWQAWEKERGLKPKAMRSLVMADVLPLYKAKYWSGVEHLPWPLSAVAYDIAVNHGQKNLGLMLDEIGNGGTATERAAALIDARERFFRAIVATRPTQQVFLKGWLRRVVAQREWLARYVKAQQAAAPSVGSKVFLRDPSGKNVEWDGREVVYGGVKLKRYPDGALQLERA